MQVLAHTSADICPHFFACRYLPIGGLKDFNVESIKLAYGAHANVIADNQV